MSMPFPISASQTDAKSPVDDNLMDSIRLDLAYLDAAVLSNKAFDYEFKANGLLAGFAPRMSTRKRIDGALVARAGTFTQARLYLEIPPMTGTIDVDIRKYKQRLTPITAISRKFTTSITSINQIAPAIATQSIAKTTAQISTQSITRWKASININSIILLGQNMVRLELASAPDADWQPGDSITIASATTGANNVTANILRIGDDNKNNIVISNASGVAQTGAAGTMSLNAWAYNYTNPINVNFVAGESVVMASHTASANNGTFAIYKTNQSGNNIIVKNSLGVAQASTPGTADASRWTYTYTSSVPTDFVAGESGIFASHTSGVNNGTFKIIAVNSGGNNMVISNSAGVAQGGVAGTANTTRWIYALTADPSASFSVGSRFVAYGATTAANNGTWTILQINRSATSNLIISNVNGVTQAGAVGNIDHTYTLLSFSTDQSANYTALTSNIEVINTISGFNKGFYDVVAVNQGGGSNFNVVVDNPTAVIQASPAGLILTESKSLFASASTRLKLTFPTDTVWSNTQNNAFMSYVTKLATSGDFSAEATVLVGDMIGMEIVGLPTGPAADAVVQMV